MSMTSRLSKLGKVTYILITLNYDSRDMLTEEKYVRWNSGTSTWDVMYWGKYVYDIAGNMLRRFVNQIVNGNEKFYFDVFLYSRGYQMTQISRTELVTSENRQFSLTYDANGNMTHIQQNAPFTDSFYNITEMEFQFDEKNRMTNYRFGGAGSYYAIKYDSLGRVRERVDLTPTTTKYYSDGRSLLQQLNDSNDVEFDYFRGPTGLMRQWEENGSPTKRFYIKDPLGTVWALVDPSNLTVKRYNYNAWGEHLDKDDTDFPTDTNYMRYIGCRVEAFGDSTHQTDAVYHFDHRHYSSQIGFLQRDELYLNDLISRTFADHYIYALNSPTNLNDPSGLWPIVHCCRQHWDWKPRKTKDADILYYEGIIKGVVTQNFTFGGWSYPEILYFDCAVFDIIYSCYKEWAHKCPDSILKHYDCYDWDDLKAPGKDPYIEITWELPLFDSLWAAYVYIITHKLPPKISVKNWSKIHPITRGYSHVTTQVVVCYYAEDKNKVKIATLQDLVYGAFKLFDVRICIHVQCDKDMEALQGINQCKDQ